MKRNIPLSFVMYLGITIGSAQDNGQFQTNLINLTPASPTMVALGKYGDVPVSYYTGTVNISIPLYEIKTSDFSLPISLSYQGGGIKVEEASSWVGLGWSLNAGGIITRSVRGYPDDQAGGYVRSPIYTVASMLDQPSSVYQQVFLDKIDLEPDMFFFNFGSHSGKFYFDQATQTFNSVPANTLQVDKDYFITNNQFKITDQGGTQYFFSLTENDNVFSKCDNAPVYTSVSSQITGWYLTSIITPTARETITLSYESVLYDIENIHNVTKNILAYRDVQTTPTGCFNAVSKCLTHNTYTGYRLKSITYPSGKIVFVANTSRYDQVADNALDSVKIYNGNDAKPYNQFALGHQYFNNANATGPITDVSSYKVRLKLTSVTEVSASGANPPYVFTYNESSPMPSRLSYAQDAWGYYNGQDNNADLVPPFIWVTANNVKTLAPGANRDVDQRYTSLGMLTSMMYPTGGTTRFEYENHSLHVSSSSSEKVVYLDNMSRCGGAQGIYCTTFTINNQLAKGAFADITIAGITCPYGPQANTCAILSIMEGTNAIEVLTGNQKGFYLSNGTYIIKADFSHSPNDQDSVNFVIQVLWQEYSSQDRDALIGGLRLKSITDNDGTQDVKVRYFTYQDPTANYSSGALVTTRPVYNYAMPCLVSQTNPFEPDATDFANLVYISRTSYSNLPLGITQGSPIGYKSVTVQTDATGVNGKTIYYYSGPADNPDMGGPPTIIADSTLMQLALKGVANFNGYPFAPVTSFEHRRGLLLKQEDYKFVNGKYKLVRDMHNDYTPTPIAATSPYGMESDPSSLLLMTTAIKCAVNVKRLALDPTSTYTFTDWVFPTIYYLASEWIRQVTTTTHTYNDDDTTLTEATTTAYNNPLHMQPSVIQQTYSDGSVLTTYKKYPLDFSIPQSPTSAAAQALLQIRQKNMITSTVESYITKQLAGASENVIDGTLTLYDPTSLLPNELKKLSLTRPKPISNFSPASVDSQGNFISNSDYESRITFSKYDNNANLLQQQKVNDFPHSYLWGYNNTYPIAEVVNATSDQIFYNSFEDNGVLFQNSSGTNIAKTGKLVLNSGNYTLPSSFAPSQSSNLIVSYWYWSNNKWNYNELPFSNNMTIASSGTNLDEVRVRPGGAQMTTYTYDLGIGITSNTDPNNQTTSYHYDSFGRLSYITDNNGKIIRSYKYHYKHQLGSK